MSRCSRPPSSNSSPLSRSVAVTVSGMRRYWKLVLGTRRAMARRSAEAGKRLRANSPISNARGSSGATSLRRIPIARRRTWSKGIPAPRAAPTTAPMDVATIWLGIRFACSSALKAPACASAFAPPPDKTSTTLLTPALLVAAFHHPLRAPLGGAVVAALLIRGLGDDRRDFRRATVLVQRDVGHVARIRVSLISGQHVLGEHLDAHLHGGAAREVHARHRRHQVADVDRLTEIDLVDGDGDALAVRMTDGGDSSDAVNEPQNVTAEHVAHDVRVMRHHQLGEDRFGFARVTGGALLRHQ